MPCPRAASCSRLVAPLRKLLGDDAGPSAPRDVQLTLTDQGVDVALKGVEVEGLDAVEALTAFCEAQPAGAADDRRRLWPRAALRAAPGDDQPVGHRRRLSRRAPSSRRPPTARRRWSRRCARRSPGRERPLDLFAGLGTFALALGGRSPRPRRRATRCWRSDGDAARDRGRAPRPLPPPARPPGAWRAFDAVDPRSAARRARSSRSRSSPPRRWRGSPMSAATRRPSRATPKLLVAGGYRLDWVKPVGQFRWSTHVELAAAFSR